MVQYNRTQPESSGVTSVTAMSCESYSSGFSGKPCNVKTEMIGEEEGRPSSCKRPKFQQWSTGSNAIHSEAVYFNPLDEPSPLGLTLRKTPSLLDLIQMKLSQEDPAFLLNTNSLNQDTGKRKDARSTSAAQASADKLKASNFPVSILRIGTWECISRYEGDLVAKCYFAKHKLVWEVLDGGLKSKIEIQWSDITALRANCPENEPGTLDIEVSRPSLFFKETNPQPRKHTLWQATSDFTGGQATMCRRHFLQCPQGLLNRHYEKLVQCDPRLNMLSKKPFLSSDSPYFDSRSTVFQEHNEPTCYGNVHNNKPHGLPHFDHLKSEYLATFTRFPDASPSVSQMLVPKCEPLDPEVRTGDATRQETTSPSSVMDSRAIEDHGSSDNDDLNMKGSKPREQLRSSESLNELLGHGSGLALSASMSNLVNHICFQQEQRISGSSFSMGEDMWASNKNVLDEIAQHLLSDSLLSATSDEQAIIARVNSMCSLLEKDVPTEHALEITHGKGEEPVIGYNLGRSTSGGDVEAGDDIDNEKPAFSRTDDLISPLLVENCSVESKCSTRISRKESCGDLLLNLPRIASLPQFFVHGSDELSTRNESNGTAGGTRLR